MKPIIFAGSLLALATGAAFSQFADETRLQEVVLTEEDGDFKQAFIEMTNAKGGMQYRNSKRDTNIHRERMTKFNSILLVEPKEFRDAMDQFKRGEYAEALKGFEEQRTRFEKMQELPNNYSSRSEFYELECLRHLGRYKEMLNRKTKYLFKGLTHEDEKEQLELMTFWEGVQNKSWKRLAQLGEQWMKKNLPGDKRVQVAYCYGLALAELDRVNEALNAFGAAVTADHSPSKELARQSVIESIKLLASTEEFKHAAELWGTDEFEPNSKGAGRLTEASRLVKYYNALYTNREPLPAELSAHIQYLPDDEKPEPEDAE